MSTPVPARTGGRWMRRAVVPVLALCLATVGLTVTAAPALAATACTAPVTNKVACENTKAGTTAWSVTADTSIEGFATQISTNVGGTVDFKVRTTSAAYRVDIYRLGYYGGDGGRLIASVNPTATLPQNQPACLRDASTGLVDCGNWAVSASWAVPSDAVSGVYQAVLHRLDVAADNSITFVVRDDASRSNMVFQTSDTTWAAYNTWGGASMYSGDGPGSGGRAYKVSYNRPLAAGESAGQVMYAEYPMIRFLESNGYDVSYIAGVDVDRDASLVSNHKIFLSVGHDEYWSGAQRTNVESARGAGVNLAFFSGNEMWWRVRWERSVDGSATDRRTMVCYKESLDGARTDPSGEWTGTWRDTRFSPAGVQPENALIGQQFKVNGNGFGTRADSLSVPAEFGRSRLWRNTAVATQSAGATYTFGAGTLGYEWDSDYDNGVRPAGLAHLSETTVQVADADVLQNDFGTSYTPGSATHNLSLYRDQRSGALVFGAGTVQWSWGLDDDHDGDGQVANTPMRQATVNLFADMGVQPTSLAAGLVAASASTDTTAPSVTLTAPASSDTLTVGAPVTVRGTATDSGGVVSGVEVSVDGGASWHPAVGRSSWSYTFTPATSGAITIQARAVDDSARLSSPVSSRATVTARTCPCSVWSTSVTPTVPAAADSSAVELGMRFQTTIDGYVTGVRFYKGSGNTGTHTGSLWTSDGQRLATGTFTGESATGWQTLTFATPVAVTAATAYVVSYWAPAGHYAADSDYFATAAVTNEPLVAVRDTAGGHSGLYLAGTTGFPTSSYRSTNYWVDPVFQATAPPDNTAPTVLSTTPLDGSSSVSRSTTVTATLSEAVQSTGIALTVTGAGGSTIGGTTTYDAGTRVVTFTPGEQLAPGTRFTATLSAVKDLAGNALATPVSWSFTSMRLAATPGLCPCGVWDDTAVPATLAEADTASVELGMRFTPTSDGTVTGARFYKSAPNTGTHTGTLWAADGTELATATFTSESTSGWQQVLFSNAVAVTAGTTYTVSYHTDGGNYSVTRGALATALTSGPLTVPGADSGANGVYQYGARSFPARSGGGANYWVDVVFQLPPDTTPPVVTSTSPGADVTSVATSSTVSATFSEPVTGATLTVVRAASATERAASSVDGTTTYRSDTRTVVFTPTAVLAAGTRYTLTVGGATDAAGNTVAAVSRSFTTSGAAACPCNVFYDSTPTTPATDDSSSVELGMRFTTDTAGYVTGVRFYKGPGNTGTHTGSLWSAGGTRLASGTFGNETSSGWQQLTFDRPVAVTAGTSYVVSYHAPNGHYAAVRGGFTTAQDNAPLHAAGDSADTPNGVYAYGGSADFPSSSYGSTNYYVDAVFTPTVATDTRAPLVASSYPTSGASAVPTGDPVEFVLDEPVQLAGATVTVTPAGGSPVTGTLSLVGTSKVRFQPTAPLPADTSVTAVVSGIADLAGNVMAGSVSTTFTTAASPMAACPCTLFPSASVPEIESVSDDRAVELGMRFSSDSAAEVSGVRFYKGAGNTGTHTGTLWSADGTALATATFVGETGSGWQQVQFSTPVLIEAGTTYVVSYHTTSGRYSATPNAFAAAIDRAPLHTVASTSTQRTGLYTYGTGAFPVTGSDASYAVDVVVRTPAAQVDLAQGGATATSSSYEGGPWGAGRAVDGITASTSSSFGWSSDSGTGSSHTESFQVDLGAARSVDRVTLWPRSDAGNVGYGFPVDATVATSVDGTTWTTVWTISGAPLPAGAQSATFASRTARYVKVTGTTLRANPNDGGSPYRMQFAEVGVFGDGTTPDTTVPTVTAVTPVAGSVGAASTVTPTATFSEAVDPATLSMSVTGPSGAVVSGTATLDAAGTVATFTPAVPLASNTAYTVRVAPVQDVAGNAMTAAATWSFTTADTAAPVITAVTGVGGAMTATVTWTTDESSSTAVQYGTSATSLTSTVSGPGGVTAHSVTLTGLAPGTTYWFRVVSVDAAGNSSTSPAATAPAAGVSTLVDLALNGATTTSSSVETSPWGAARAVDGITTSTASSSGWSSGDTNSSVNHTETFQVNLGAARSVNQITLWPRSDAGNVGYGFPVDATVATSVDGTNWTTVWTISSAQLPAGAQTTTFTSRTARYVKVTGTTLRANPGDGNRYRMQFAEVGVFGDGATPDTTAPTITAVTPVAGSTGAALNAAPTATFSEPVAAGTLSMSVTGPSGAVVAGTATLNPAGTVATFTPSAPLVTETAYTVRVASVQDRAGNAIAAAYTWSFSTPIDLALNRTVTASSSVETSPWGRAKAVDGITTSTSTSTGWSSSNTLNANHTEWFQVDLGAAKTVNRIVLSPRTDAGNVGYGYPVNATVEVSMDGTYWTTVSTIAGAPLPTGAQTLSFANRGARYVRITGTTLRANPADGGNYRMQFAEVGVYGDGSTPDTTAPTVTAVTPTAGSTGVVVSATPAVTFSEPVVASSITMTLTGPAGAVTGTVALNAAGTVATFTPAAALSSAATYTVAVSGVADLGGNRLAAASSSTFQTVIPPCPCSVFGSADTPPAASVTTTTATERGMRFSSLTGGWVTGVRFYKGTGATGVHTGSVWTTAGQRLGTVSFTNETASGWQTATFAQPVQVTAGTTYVVSYTAPSGRWSETASYFTAAKANGNLGAPATSSSAPNGLSGTAGEFPATSGNGANYWVDVVMATTAPAGASPDTIAPTVTGYSPVGSGQSILMTTPTAVLSEPVTGLTMTVTSPSGTVVRTTTSYTAATLTAKVSLSQLLSSRTTYTVTVAGGKDAAGNLMTPFTWTFTTS